MDLLDPDELYADHDRRVRERQDRRAARRRSRLGGRTSKHGALATAPGRTLLIAVAAIALVTVVGLIALWPSNPAKRVTHSYSRTVQATVRRTFTGACGGTGATTCRDLEIEVAGKRSKLTLGPVGVSSSISPGTPIRVAPSTGLHGQTASAGSEPWQFVDIDRHGSLLTIAIALLLVALIVIRWRGLLAALGAGLSILLLVKFLVPAILDGEPALLVAIVCSLAVMFITVTLTHGVGPQSLAATLGVSSTLLLACVLAVLAVHLVHLDGRTDELSTYLEAVNRGISLQGIVLAGVLIGALGVLADTAVTQASAVMALRRANPGLTAKGLYRSAFHVGRDHLSATIHTLVLAYAGASLPLLLVSQATGVGFTDAVSAQDIAEPVVATLVGCIALVGAVPVTTGLAAMLMANMPTAMLPDAHHH
jgi:uncharacterized membrane protein